MVTIPELSIYVFYDIEDDGARASIAETCKDYGLARVQFSGFFGALGRNKREELFLKLSHILVGKAGKVLLLPVCEKDMKTRMELFHPSSAGGGHEGDG